MSFRVETRADGGTTIGAAGPHTVAVGAGDAGWNGGQLLHLAVGACVSNDLFREAALRGIVLTRVAVTVDGGFAGAPAVSDGIGYAVEIEGDAPDADLRALVAHVDAIAEIPNSLRRGTEVRLVS
jgi:putative redox protein